MERDEDTEIDARHAATANNEGHQLRKLSKIVARPGKFSTIRCEKPMKDQSESALLQSPAEIRLKILRYLLKIVPSETGEGEFLATQGNFPFIQIIMTCQQLLQEGVTVLYQENKLHIRLIRQGGADLMVDALTGSSTYFESNVIAKTWLRRLATKFKYIDFSINADAQHDWRQPILQLTRTMTLYYSDLTIRVIWKSSSKCLSAINFLRVVRCQKVTICPLHYETGDNDAAQFQAVVKDASSVMMSDIPVYDLLASAKKIKQCFKSTAQRHGPRPKVVKAKDTSDTDISQQTRKKTEKQEEPVTDFLRFPDYISWLKLVRDKLKFNRTIFEHDERAFDEERERLIKEIQEGKEKRLGMIGKEMRTAREIDRQQKKLKAICKDLIQGLEHREFKQVPRKSKTKAAGK